jgi:streptomycin 6-kinase
MSRAPPSDMAARLAHHARQWDVRIEFSRASTTALLGFGTRRGRAVVLKIVAPGGDEWWSGAAAAAMAGTGGADVLAFDGGAILLERLIPGTPLTLLSHSGRDDEATGVIAALVASRGPTPATASPEDRRADTSLPTSWTFPSVLDWGAGFERYLATGDNRIPRPLVAEASRLYRELASTQQSEMLLHGDLHHDNILSDTQRGWRAIDPKGVRGEREYECGAMLRNPAAMPDLFTNPLVIDRRLHILQQRAPIDRERVIAWAFAQAILSEIWTLEDAAVVDELSSYRLALARALRARL